MVQDGRPCREDASPFWRDGHEQPEGAVKKKPCKFGL